MKNQGWASHYRKQYDHWVSKIQPYCPNCAWTYLYTFANHEDREFCFNGQIARVNRGQLLTSIKKLAERWQWKYKRTSNFLNRLEKSGMIRQQRTSKFTLLTIVNYEKHQRNNHKRKNMGKSKEDQRQTNNNVNKLNKNPLTDA